MPDKNFGSGNTENQLTPTHSHKQHVHEIEIQKTNSCYTPETMPPNPATKRCNMATRWPF